ncbi:hypothetical protein [Streptomyces caniscabiei]|uniref:Uncharacterized protein n=1 Tax=Streptomyces caniscabiei TaxID=2746961 RepID=A0ABU4MQ69_9ACTN|nr:hypothetical protein [Streptomyces caniscabiei]MDX2945724.1 hypothetical protein [Streptomyces caniscabiei]MDX2949634.1 hypothetical protein [Streptomyces caniscabiei]MDX2983077.1 hypothetical protein [Streptomyces caniscabiei]MDX3012578.1 hypothetical protein [Streptomyces caniscabiei]MDX3039296.1 hypothetical protein [Streptomyces caniscabiei]
MTACTPPSPTTGHGNDAGRENDGTNTDPPSGDRGESGDSGASGASGEYDEYDEYDSRGGGPGGSAGGDEPPPPGCVITADGTYAARLALDGESWFPERWTLDGHEPYAVPLPGNQPEEPGTEVLPLTDGRVLIHRVAADLHLFSLLYPTGPGTGELPLGAVECAVPTTRMRLLPPSPCGERAYALALGRTATAVWLVAGGTFGPELVAQLPGRCSGGIWLDAAGRLLALDQESGGRTKSVVVDVEQGGAVSPLLQIADDSNDRVLLADPDSGLLLIRSDAPSPGHDRLGWGVLGSTLPVRFPECLRAPEGHRITPFAIQPGQILTPESCAVALRVDGPRGSWVGVWRPSARRILHLPAPEGWLTGAGLWSREGVLHLPYATGVVRCGVARVGVPWGKEPEDASAESREEASCPGTGAVGAGAVGAGPSGAGSSGADPSGSAGIVRPSVDERSVDGRSVDGRSVGAEPSAPVVVARPVPLQQAPLEGRVPEEMTVG